MSKVTTKFEAVDTGMVATIQKIERETKSMKNTTQKTEKQVDLSFAAMAKAGAGLAIGIGLVKGAFAAITGTLDKFGEALDMGGRLSDLSASTGETAGNLLLLERAFQNSGVGADKVGTSINKLQKFMSDANTGITKNKEVINQLGLSYNQLVQLSPTEQLGMIAEKINLITSPTERAAAAMNIFGRSGGALLPFLQNFSGEMSNAQDELGSLTRIMDAKNAVFDTVSDKIEIIKGKFAEFAAGILSKIIPALELFTTVLSRFDAAGFGEKLAEAFIGGQNAMQGFGAALQSLKMGDFATSWSITFKSIELQVKETFNQIYLIAVSTISGIQAFIKSIFKEGSALLNIITSSFEIIANKMNIIISKGLNAILGGIPGITSRIEENLKFFESSIDTSKNKIKNGFTDIIPQMQDAGKAFGEAFDEKFKTTKPIIDTAEEKAKMLEMRSKVALKSAQEAEKGLKESLDPLKNLGKNPPNPLKLMKETTDKVSKNMEKIVEKAKELTLIEKLNANLANAKVTKEAGINPLKKEAEGQIEEGKFKQAEATIKKIAIAEEEAELRIDETGKKDRRDIEAIAREEGIRTAGKTRAEIRKEILEKRKKDKPEAENKKEAEKEKEKKVEDKVDPLFKMVEMIKDLVAKIEPKLPTHALAL